LEDKEKGKTNIYTRGWAMGRMVENEKIENEKSEINA